MKKTVLSGDYFLHRVSSVVASSSFFELPDGKATILVADSTLQAASQRNISACDRYRSFRGHKTTSQRRESGFKSAWISTNHVDKDWPCRRALCSYYSTGDRFA